MMMIRMMIRDDVLEDVKKYIEETTNNKEDSKTSIRNAALVFACNDGVHRATGWTDLVIRRSTCGCTCILRRKLNAMQDHLMHSNGVQCKVIQCSGMCCNVPLRMQHDVM